MEDAADLGADFLSTSQRQQDQSLVKLANSILQQLHISQKIHNYSQINGSVFVTMYEGLCGELLEDMVRQPRCMEDDAHNAQTVIDALALDVLHTSLSHISGEAVAKGDRIAVGNLLDLFSSLVEFILNRIECDLTSDEENLDTERLATSELIDDILSRDLKNATLDEDGNDGDVSNENDQDLVEDKMDDVERGRNSTLELIRESEEIERRLREQEALRKRLEEEERKYEMEEDERLRYEEMESRRRIMEEDRIREQRSREEELRLVEEAMARYGEGPTPALDLSHDSSDGSPMFESTRHLQDRTESSSDYITPTKGQYSSLLSMAEETCELSRSAVRNSPARAKAERSAFLEAAIKSALKKIDREAKGVEKLVDEVPSKKSVRLKLSDEFNTDVPRESSPMKSPYHRKPVCDDNNNAGAGVIPSVTISPPRGEPGTKVGGSTKKAARVRPLNTRPTSASTRDKTDRLKHLYAYDYKNLLADHQELNQKAKHRADTIEKNMRKNLSKSSRKGRPPVSDRRFRGRQKSASCSPPKHRSDRDVGGDDYMNYLLDAFPNLYLSTNTIQELWRQSVKQIEQLNKIEQETKRKDSLHQQLEHAARRQHLVSEIFRKDIQYRRRMAEIKERRAQKKAVQQCIQEKRAQSARVRRYYQDFQLGMRAKMLNKRVRDELIFKRVFKDGLNIQRDCIRDMRKYAKEQRLKKGKAQQDEIESLENFYRDQFMMLADAMQKERVDLASREKAQNKVIDRMKRELRRKMEKEIRDIQAELVDEDDGHFRQLDADALRQDLLLDKYKSCA